MPKHREDRRSQLVDLDLELYGHQREYFSNGHHVSNNKENCYDFSRPLYNGGRKHAGDALPPRPPGHHHQHRQRRPVDLDDDEVMEKPIDLDAFSTSSISDDDDEAVGRGPPLPRYAFYSTSDLTTSDSDIYGRWPLAKDKFRSR